MSTHFEYEKEAFALGHAQVAGVDEAGRGPLAGPVVAAAVILPQNHVPKGINDSKKISPQKRRKILQEIFEVAQVGVAAASPSLIAKLNIRGATLWAMRQAVLSLAEAPSYVLVDGRDVPPNLPCAGRAIVGGDAKSTSIAAASIVAKVVRDDMCEHMANLDGRFGFETHKAYGTKQHLNALEKFGATAFHRADFAPVRRALGKN